jgi:hypothetical protein
VEPDNTLEAEHTKHLSEDTEHRVFDIDGDGKTSAWELKLCQVCILTAIAIMGGQELMAAL